jgi:hypothetical protein
MRKTLFALVLIALALVASPANALYEGLQCVPFARALTGVTIFGDAHTWWNQAEGKYQRGNRLSVRDGVCPHGNMRSVSCCPQDCRPQDAHKPRQLVND